MDGIVMYLSTRTKQRQLVLSCSCNIYFYMTFYMAFVNGSNCVWWAGVHHGLADLAVGPEQHSGSHAGGARGPRRPWPGRPRAQQDHRQRGRAHRLRRHRPRASRRLDPSYPHPPTPFVIHRSSSSWTFMGDLR